MSGSDRPIWFAGDLADPLAGAIAAALGPATRLIPCPGGLPEPWPPISPRSPRAVVVHRAILGATDAGRLAALRGRLDAGRALILCVGPHVRYADIERWARGVDLVLPEALAAETIGRHVGVVEPAAAPPDGRGVAVVSTGPELRATWGAILRAGGYDVVAADRPEAAPAGLVAVWDVPVLEPTWPDRLRELAARGPVVAAIGFLDRTTRQVARAAGASACLDMPADLADLVLAVDRLAGRRRDPAHPAVPGPSGGLKASSRAQR